MVNLPPTLLVAAALRRSVMSLLSSKAKHTMCTDISMKFVHLDINRLEKKCMLQFLEEIKTTNSRYTPHHRSQNNQNTLATSEVGAATTARVSTDY